jgi:hypothetical protein
MSDLAEALQEVIKGCESMVTTLDASNYASEYDWNMNARIRGVRTSLNDAKSIAEEILKDVSKRVYLIQVTTTVDMNIKVLAKNEDDAIEWACRTADDRIGDTLARDYDIYYDSTGEVLGDESPQDDGAEEEYPYDD